MRPPFGVQLDDLTVKNRVVAVHLEGEFGGEVGKAAERVTVGAPEPDSILSNAKHSKEQDVAIPAYQYSAGRHVFSDSLEAVHSHSNAANQQEYRPLFDGLNDRTI